MSHARRATAMGRFEMLPGAYGVLCGPAPTLGAGSSSRTWKTPPVGSTLAPTHHRATKALASVGVREVDRQGIIKRAASSRKASAAGEAVPAHPRRQPTSLP